MSRAKDLPSVDPRRPNPTMLAEEVEAYLALVEWVLRSFPSPPAKLDWLAVYLPRTFALLQLTHRWDELFGHEEVTA